MYSPIYNECTPLYIHEDFAIIVIIENKVIQELLDYVILGFTWV